MKFVGSLVLIYALIVLSGGVWGYMHAGSLPSLLAGGISGLALLISSWGIFYKKMFAEYISLGLTALLLGVFIFRFLRTHAFFPSGVMSLLSLIVLILITLHVRHKLKS